MISRISNSTNAFGPAKSCPVSLPSIARLKNGSCASQAVDIWFVCISDLQNRRNSSRISVCHIADILESQQAPQDIGVAVGFVGGTLSAETVAAANFRFTLPSAPVFAVLR